MTLIERINALATRIANEVKGKQNTLVSGTNIKTINSVSVLGSGNISTKPVQVTGITIASASWSLVSGLYEYDLADANITATSIVDVIPENADISTIQNAQVLPKTVSASGSVKLFAKNAPAANISVTINIYAL